MKIQEMTDEQLLEYQRSLRDHLKIVEDEVRRRAYQPDRDRHNPKPLIPKTNVR